MNVNNVSLMLDAMNKAIPALFECGMIAVTGGLQNWVHILLHAHLCDYRRRTQRNHLAFVR